jgi:CBS domain containing-hemolysin-like protein
LMLATSQLGITICSLLILNVSEPAIHHLLEIPLGLTSLSATAISVVAFVVALVLVTFLHVVLGEMVPKNLSFSVPDRAALLLAPPLVLFSRVFRPVIWALNALANAAVRAFGVEPKDETTSTYTLDEVANIVAQSTREGTLEDSTGALSAAFEFTAKKVADVAVPVASLVVLPVGCSPADVQAQVAEHGYSRYLVGDPDAMLGYLHLKDVLDLSSEQAFHRPVPGGRIRRLATVPHDADLEDALAALRTSGAHLARCVDVDGGSSGVLFLEDIIEELVGEVRDATSTP